MEKSSIAIVVSVLGFLWGIYVFNSNRKRGEEQDWQDKIDKAVAPFHGMPEAIALINAELQVLKKQVEVFWKGVSFSSAQALHSPHTEELDRLLEKFQREEIQNEKELKRLKELLQGIAKSDPDPVRQKFAMDILTLIHVRFEIGGDLVDALRRQNQSVDHSLHEFSARLKP